MTLEKSTSDSPAQHAGEKRSTYDNSLKMESALKVELDREPESASANYNLGSLLFERGQASLAHPLLQKAVQIDPLIRHVVRLGECLESLGENEAALRCYRVSLDKRQNDAELWCRYGSLLSLAGRKYDAEDAYTEALKADPDNHQASISLARLLWDRDKRLATSFLDEALERTGTDSMSRAQLLSLQLTFREWSGRIEHGMMPYHASSLDELFFHHAESTLLDLRNTAAALVRQHNSSAWAKMTSALATFASGDSVAAQKLFAAVDDGALSPMASSIRFDEAFFSTLRASDESSLTTNLPEVITVKTGEFNDSDILYMSCNDSYFDAFAKPLLRSLAHCGKSSQVHIHLMDSGEHHTKTALEFCRDLQGIQTALTVERPDLHDEDPSYARSYFHAIRFIRFYFHLQYYDQTLWMMDVDGLFNRSPEHFYTKLSEADIALRVRPGRLEPWNQFNACLVGVRPKAAALDYLRSVAAYIAYFYQNHSLPWGIDQLAMYACFVDAQRRGDAPTLHLLDDKALDYSHEPEGILWCSSGATKVAAFSRSTEDDPKATEYDRAFARYRKETDPP